VVWWYNLVKGGKLMSEYKEILVKETPRWVKILVVILAVSTFFGWSAFGGQRDEIKEYHQKIEDLRSEERYLQSQIDDLTLERDELFNDVRKLTQKPFDVSRIAEPHRSHTIEDVFNAYQFWNTGQDIDDFYYKLGLETGMFTWIGEPSLFESSWDVSDLASGIWDVLHNAEIKAVIVIGNLDSDNARFSESNNAWLLVFYEDIFSNENTVFILKPLEHEIVSIPVEKELPLRRDMKREIDYMSGYGVSSLWAGGEEYLQGYVYATSLDLEADIEER
jgi:hypothetical protein